MSSGCGEKGLQRCEGFFPADLTTPIVLIGDGVVGEALLMNVEGTAGFRRFDSELRRQIGLEGETARVRDVLRVAQYEAARGLKDG